MHLISVPTYPQPSRHSHTLDLKAPAGLTSSPGRVTCMAWTSDGYALAVGYERGWAVWSVLGRLNGYGAESAEHHDRSSKREPFMRGIIQLVSLVTSLNTQVDTDIAVLGTGQSRALRPYRVEGRHWCRCRMPASRPTFCQISDHVTAFTCKSPLSDGADSRKTRVMRSCSSTTGSWCTAEPSSQI